MGYVVSHTFSKRHYEAVAEALRKARERADGMFTGASMPTSLPYGIGMAQAEITQMFADDNPNFDGERFAQASGMRG